MSSRKLFEGVYWLPPEALDPVYQPIGALGLNWHHRLDRAVLSTGRPPKFKGYAVTETTCEFDERATALAGGVCIECAARACIDCLVAGTAVHEKEREDGTICPFRTDPPPGGGWTVVVGTSSQCLKHMRFNSARLEELDPPPPAPTLAPVLRATDARRRIALPVGADSPKHIRLASALEQLGTPGRVMSRSQFTKSVFLYALEKSEPVLVRASDDDKDSGPFAEELRKWAWDGPREVYSGVLDNMYEVTDISTGGKYPEMQTLQASMDGINDGERWRLPDVADLYKDEDEDDDERARPPRRNKGKGKSKKDKKGKDDKSSGEGEAGKNSFAAALMSTYEMALPCPEMQSFSSKHNLFAPAYFPINNASTTGPYAYISGSGGVTEWHSDCSAAMNVSLPAFEGSAEALWAFISWEEWPKALKALGKGDDEIDPLRFAFRLALEVEDVEKIVKAGVTLTYFFQDKFDAVIIPGGSMHTVVSLGSSFKLAADYLHPLELEHVKNQEVARGTFYIPRAMPGGERPDHETGMTDLAKTDERCMSAIANLGKAYGGELFEDSESGSESEDE